MHYLLPKALKKSHSPHELACMQHKGSFSLLPEKLSDDLIRTYFLHVHCFLPILDVQSLLAQYTHPGCQQVSLLLLWGMFLAAANVSESLE